MIGGLSDRIIGPGSGHQMHCPICGYRGNSYYHQCQGGQCHICQGMARGLCPVCDKVTCRKHMRPDIILGQDICDTCASKRTA